MKKTYNPTMPERINWLLTASTQEIQTELRKAPLSPPELQAALIVAFRKLGEIEQTWALFRNTETH